MQTEQRLVDILIKHWRRRKGGEPMVVYEQFVPEALGNEIWHNCCTFSMRKSGNKWIYITEFTGDNICNAIGKDITGDVLTLGKGDLQVSRVLKKADDVIRLGDALTDEGHFVNEQSKIIKFRSCLLPFGRNSHYTHLVLGLSWRAFD